jgi:hypothetical protein
VNSCSVCGAPLSGPGASCDYDVPLDRAPGIGKAGQLATGLQTHAEHEVHIARWRVHHADARGGTPEVNAWARERLAREGHVVPPLP